MMWPFGTGTRCVPGSNGHAPHQGGTYNCMSLPEETAIPPIASTAFRLPALHPMLKEVGIV